MLRLFDSEGQKMRLISWNVNSVRARLDLLKKLIEELKPDIVALQEIKCEEKDFPTDVMEELGYKCAVSGQKQYNGVAILYKKQYEVVSTSSKLLGCSVESARYIEILIEGGLRISSIYVPNGCDMYSQSYKEKIEFLNALCFVVRSRIFQENAWLLLGDFNVIAHNLDTYNKSSEWENTGMASPQVRKMWRRLLNQGLIDAGELDRKMTFQDYRSAQVRLRIDHALLSPGAADVVETFDVLHQWRGYERPSDHMPICVNLDLSRIPSLKRVHDTNPAIPDALLGVRAPKIV